MKWKNITIKKYQLLCEINQNDSIVDIEMMALSIIHGMDIEHYESMTLAELEKEIKAIQFWHTPPLAKEGSTWKHGLYKYHFTCNPKQMIAEQFVQLQKLLEEGSIENMHTILALLTTKKNLFGRRQKVTIEEFEQRAELFRNNMSIEIGMGHALFFWTYFLRSYSSIRPYLTAAMEKAVGEYGLTLPRS